MVSNVAASWTSLWRGRKESEGRNCSQVIMKVLEWVSLWQLHCWQPGQTWRRKSTGVLMGLVTDSVCLLSYFEGNMGHSGDMEHIYITWGGLWQQFPEHVTAAGALFNLYYLCKCPLGVICLGGQHVPREALRERSQSVLTISGFRHGNLPASKLLLTSALQKICESDFG